MNEPRHNDQLILKKLEEMQVVLDKNTKMTEEMYAPFTKAKTIREFLISLGKGVVFLGMFIGAYTVISTFIHNQISK